MICRHVFPGVPNHAVERRHRGARDQRQLPGNVRLLPVRLLRLAHRPGVLPEQQRDHVAALHLHDVRCRLSHAAAGRHRAWRLCGPGRPPARADRDAVHHGDGHDPDRVRAELRHHRRACSGPRADRAAAAGLLGGRRARRRVGLSLRDGDAGPQGLLRRLAVGQPAGRHHRGGRDRLRAQQVSDPARDQRLGLARSLLHRLLDRAVHLRHSPLARGDRSIQGAPTGRAPRKRSGPWSRTGRSWSPAC